MSNLFLISDTHFGHAKMCDFLRDDGTKVRPFKSAEEQDEYMIEKWNSVVNKKDQTYHLGDVVIHRRSLEILSRLNGVKVLIKGNHDIFPPNDYLKYFKDVRGSHLLHKDYRLTHVPWHTSCVRDGEFNLHGHIHYHTVLGADGKPDPRYINMCVEHWDYTPVPFEQIKKILAERVV
jgi:calcineurin-like phosphoesterase family protein